MLNNVKLLLTLFNRCAKAQVVVDRAASDFETEIEIIDLNGIIIASSRRDRINQTNNIVFNMLKEKSGYLDYKCELTDISGGGYAIEYNNKLLGVLFIFGDRHDNKDIINLVTMIIKISIQYEVTRGQSIIEPRNEECFVRDLLSTKIDTENGEIITWGTRLGYDMNLPRAVIVIDLQPKENEYFNINLNLGYDNSIEHMREIVKNKIRDNEFLNIQDIISYYRDGCLLVIKSFLDINDRENKYKALDKICYR